MIDWSSDDYTCDLNNLLYYNTPHTGVYLGKDFYNMKSSDCYQCDNNVNTTKVYEDISSSLTDDFKNKIKKESFAQPRANIQPQPQQLQSSYQQPPQKSKERRVRFDNERPIHYPPANNVIIIPPDMYNQKKENYSNHHSRNILPFNWDGITVVLFMTVLLLLIYIELRLKDFRKKISKRYVKSAD
jgi:hypothetical protein